MSDDSTNVSSAFSTSGTSRRAPSRWTNSRDPERGDQLATAAGQQRPVAGDDQPGPGARAAAPSPAPAAHGSSPSAIRPTVPNTHASPAIPSSRRTRSPAAGAGWNRPSSMPFGITSSRRSSTSWRLRANSAVSGDTATNASTQPARQVAGDQASAAPGVIAVLGVDDRGAREPGGRRAVDQRHPVVGVHQLDLVASAASARAGGSGSDRRPAWAGPLARRRSRRRCNSAASGPSGGGASDSTVTRQPARCWDTARSNATRSCPPMPNDDRMWTTRAFIASGRLRRPETRPRRCHRRAGRASAAAAPPGACS